MESEEGTIFEIFKVNQTKSIYINNQDLNALTISQMIDKIAKQEGKTPHIYPHQQPLSSQSSLSFLSPFALLSLAIDQFPNLCFTHNNPSFQQTLPIHPTQPTQQTVLVVFQSFQNSYFVDETFKLSLDCKMLFLSSLAQRYGPNSALIYYQFRLPLNLFGKDQTIKDSLIKFCHPGSHLIINTSNQQDQPFFKTVRNPSIVNHQQYWVIQIEGQFTFIVFSRQADLMAVQQLLSIAFQSQVQIKNKQGQSFSLPQLKNSKKGEQWSLARKKDQRQYLQIKVVNSIFIGTTSKYIMFVQESHILHIYNIKQPYQLINSVILNCSSSNYLDEEIPLLISQTNLFTYQITKNMIALKYFQIPNGTFMGVKHFKWHPNEYGPIMCSSLDLLGVPLLKKQKTRIFYIYNPDNYYEIDCPQKYWDMWVSKIGNNNFSDNTGLFAISKINKLELSIYNFHSKQKILTSSIFLDKPQMIFFNPQASTFVVKYKGMKNIWYEINFQSGLEVDKIKLQNDHQLMYTPSGKKIIITDKTCKVIGQQTTFRICQCLLKQGDTLFCKDTPNIFHHFQYIYSL